MKMIDTPRFFRSRTRSKKCFFSSGVSVAVGSSKMITFALCSTARAISTICFLAAPSAPTSRRRERRRSSATGGTAARRCRCRAIDCRSAPDRGRCSGRRSLSARGCSPGTPWRCRAAALRAATSARPDCPRSVIVPEVSVTTPAMTLVSVDLPAPFSPTSAWISPRRSSKSTPRSPERRRKALVALSKCEYRCRSCAELPRRCRRREAAACVPAPLRARPDRRRLRQPTTTPWFMPSARLCSE